MQPIKFSIASWLALWMLATTAIAQSASAADAVDTTQLKQAATRAIQIVEKSSAEYLKQRECFSCHHQAMSIFALMDARAHGLKVDMQNLHQQVRRTREHLERGQADYRQGKGQGGGVDTAGYALSALSAAGLPRNETTDAVAHYLLEIHSAKKHWACSSNRPPTESSDISTTAMAMRGLATYFNPQDLESAEGTRAIDRTAPERLRKRIEDCDQWLAKQKPADTEERVFRIFIAKARPAFDPLIQSTNTLQPEIERTMLALLQQELLDAQRADGGCGSTTHRIRFSQRRLCHGHGTLWLN